MSRKLDFSVVPALFFLWVLGVAQAQASACAEAFPLQWQIVVDSIEETSSAGQPAWNLFLRAEVVGEAPPGEVQFRWAGAPPGAELRYFASVDNLDTVVVSAELDGVSQGSLTRVIRPSTGLVPGPKAGFSFEIENDTISFTNETQNTNGVRLNYDWRYGNESTGYRLWRGEVPPPATFPPGEYCAVLFVGEQSGTFGGFDEFDQRDFIFQDFIIGGGETTLTITPDKDSYDVSDDPEVPTTGTATILIDNAGTDEHVVTFADPFLTLAPDWVVELELPELPPSVTVGGDRPPYTLTVPFNVLEHGVAILSGALSSRNTVTGLTTEVKEDAPIVASPFKIEVSVEPQVFKVNDTPRDDLTQACRDYRRPPPVNPDPNEPLPNPEVANCVEVEVKVTNITSQPISDVTALDEENIRQAVRSLDPEEIGRPLTHLEYLPPLLPDEETIDRDLAPGETKTHRFLLEPFGGSSLLEVRPVFRGTQNGEQIQGSGTAEFKLVEDVLLRFGARVVDPGRSRIAGAPIPIAGFMENLSTTNWITATVFPIVEDNAGRGHLYDPTLERVRITTFDTDDCNAFAEVDAAQLPELFVPIMIPPRESETAPATRVDLEGVLATLCWQVNSNAKVSYVVEAYTLETDEDGNRVTQTVGGREAFLQKDRLVDQVEYVTDAPFNFKFNVPLRGNPKVEVSDSFCDELDWLDQYLACEAARGVHSFATGFVELPGFLIDGTKYVVKSNVTYGASLMHWSANQLVVGYDALLGETDASKAAARAKLRAEIDLLLFSLERGAIITAEQSDKIGDAAVVAIDGIVEDFRNGDYRQIAGRTAYAAGDNIDALLTGGVVKTIASRVQKGYRVKKVGQVSEIEKAVGEGLEQLSKRRSQREVDRIAEEARRRGEDILTNGDLKPNDPLSYDLIYRYVGVAKETVEKIEDIAQRWKVQIAFRSRGFGAIAKIRDGLAYWKPMPIKQKNVNQIDIDFLGYPPEAKDFVLILEPPLRPDPLIRDLKDWDTSQLFTNQLDEWMTRTGIARPAGLEALDARLAEAFSRGENIKLDDFELPQDMDRYLQVRERLRTRVVEWEKYTSDPKLFGPDLDGDLLTDGVNMRFGFREQGLPAIFDTLAPRDNLLGNQRSLRLVEGFEKPDGTIVRQVDGRQVYDLQMNGPAGFKRISGDIDFLTILDKSGGIIKNPLRRFAVYLELSWAVGMQHGESFTFFLRLVRARFLEAHVLGRRGSEALVNIMHHNDGTARRRASYFVRNRAVMEDLDNGVVRLDPDQHFIPLTSTNQVLRSGRDIAAGILKPSSYLERVDYWLRFYLKGIWPLRSLSSRVDGLSDEDVASEFEGDPAADDSRVLRATGEGLSELVPAPGDAAGGVFIDLRSSTDGPSKRFFIPDVQRAEDAPAVRQIDFVWRQLTVAQAKQSDGLIRSLPITVLEARSQAGTAAIAVAGLETLAMPATSPFLEVGQTLVIDPAAPNAEVVVIDSVDPLTLTAPLTRTHDSGIPVAVVPARFLTGATDQPVSDTDGDGVADVNDAFPNDPLETQDTDGDGVGNVADPDDDGDGTSDDDEARFNSDPLDALDTPEDHRPARPSVLAAVMDPMAPLSRLSVDATAFSDPDESGEATSRVVQITGPLDDGSTGVLFLGAVQSLEPLTLPQALLDPGTPYELYLRYGDESGLTSGFSEPVGFSTAEENPADLDGNSVEDAAELGQDTDLNANGTPDPEEGIVAFAEGVSGLPMGLAASDGSVVHVSTLTAAELAFAVDEDLPYGLVGFRVDGLAPRASIDVTFYLPEEGRGERRWLQYDPNRQALIDLSAQANADGNRVVVTYVDGGVGDLDGSVNGRIVDPSGLSVTECASGNCAADSASSSSGSDSRCFVATALFGSSARETDALRAFRDQYLRRSTLGQWFIEWYYAHSPSWVRATNDLPRVRAVARFALEPFAEAAAAVTGGSARVPVPQVGLLIALLLFAQYRRSLGRVQ
ncbi:MAG: CFI-box-CTERM domain-containing protein [Pseudomonadota bacterium]